MPPIRAFRTSLYLSLALAILAIGVAGGDLLPELPFLTAFSLLVLAVIYFTEGRWQLSLRSANMVGLILAALLGLWAIFQVVRPPTGLADLLPWPASALPYLAPVLMVLIPAKLMRPKHVGDYWTMHALGLLAMALACAMAMEGLFFLVFIAYSVTFVWSLVTFQVYRELGPELAERPLAGGRWRAVRPAVLWAALAGAAAFPLFWATPRSGAEWELAINTRGRSTTGIADGPVDLNKTGTVDVNSETAFEFFAASANGQPFLDLPGDMRFRSLYLHTYESGRWVRNQGGIVTDNRDRAIAPKDPTREPYSRFPDLGPGAIYLSFVLQPRLARTPPVADPVDWRGGQNTPIQSQYSDGTYRSWVHKFDGSFDGTFNYDTGPPRYIQMWSPPVRPGESPIIRVGQSSLSYLANRPSELPRLQNYTDRLIERLVAEGTLPPAVLTDRNTSTGGRLPQYHEMIARALERHLAASGEFSYTLELTRKDKTIDPAEDFLLNTKAGHCQRFATALVLMLRSQYIPAQMVLGYRGCIGRGDGWYEVHEDHAHAWVDVLLPANDAPPAAAPNALEPKRWLTLDPTPSAPDINVNVAAAFFEQARQKWDAVLKALLLAYNRDSRDQAVEALGNWLVDDDGWLYAVGFAALLAAAVAGWRRARRRAAFLAGYPNLVRRLAAAMSRVGYTWRTELTAQENAISAAANLGARPATQALAFVPASVVAAYYAERFGEQPVSASQRAEIEGGLKKLESARAAL
jgi:protein-glutamine gamma-glutamyltransferase